MSSMANSSASTYYYSICGANNSRSIRYKSCYYLPRTCSLFRCQHQHEHGQQQQDGKSSVQIGLGRREVLLRSSELAVLGAIFNFSGKKPEYLGVQKNTADCALALCPATKNCISTCENATDLVHYAPPWNYNPQRGRGTQKPVTRETAMEELLQVIKSTKPDKFTPTIVENRGDYVHVEYRSALLGFVDDVEFWYPPGRGSIVEYRSASRLGNFDFDINRKRIKALRLALEKKGWASEDTF